MAVEIILSFFKQFFLRSVFFFNKSLTKIFLLLKIIKNKDQAKEGKIESRMRMSNFFCKKENLNVEKRRNNRTRSRETSASEEEG